jgi:hypothetical protein
MKNMLKGILTLTLITAGHAGLIPIGDEIPIENAVLDKTNGFFILEVKRENLPEHWQLEAAATGTNNVAVADGYVYRHYEIADTELAKLDWQADSTYLLGTNGDMVKIGVSIVTPGYAGCKVIPQTNGTIECVPCTRKEGQVNLFRLRRL